MTDQLDATIIVIMVVVVVGGGGGGRVGGVGGRRRGVVEGLLSGSASVLIVLVVLVVVVVVVLVVLPLLSRVEEDRGGREWSRVVFFRVGLELDRVAVVVKGRVSFQGVVRGWREARHSSAKEGRPGENATKRRVVP